MLLRQIGLRPIFAIAQDLAFGKIFSWAKLTIE